MRSSYFLYIFCVLLILCSSVQIVSAEGGYVYSAKWGSPGSEDGQFYTPSGVAVDSTGNVYVTDEDNNRVQKFTSSGEFITKWGSSGSGDGQFSYPQGIAVDGTGDVYVVDAVNKRIQKFTSTGEFITKWGTGGRGDGQFNFPQSVAVDSAGDVYVVDSNTCQVQKFTSTGEFITKWGSEGTENRQFLNPEGVAVDSAGNVYIADSSFLPRIQKFTSTGEFITKWGSEGTEYGRFSYPMGIAVDNTSKVYITDSGNNRIQKFSSTGTFNTKWGISGSGDGEFNKPQGIAVDREGNVYVADYSNNRIQKFVPVTPVPPSEKVPRDLNNDGLYEDINGNGALDFNDVVTFFNQMDWIAKNEPPAAFDFNKNSRIDFSDIVVLFNEIGNEPVPTPTVTGGVLASQTVVPSAQDQTITARDLTLTIPGGALNQTSLLRIATVSQPPAPPTGTGHLVVYDITIGDQVQFNQPLGIEYPYDPATIPAGGDPYDPGNLVGFGIRKMA